MNREKKRNDNIPGPRRENNQGEKSGQVLLIVCVYSPHRSTIVKYLFIIDLTNAIFLSSFFFLVLFILGMIVKSMFFVNSKRFILTMFFVPDSFSLTFSSSSG